jgi:hypothetical protein
VRNQSSMHAHGVMHTVEQRRDTTCQLADHASRMHDKGSTPGGQQRMPQQATCRQNELNERCRNLGAVYRTRNMCAVLENLPLHPQQI